MSERAEELEEIQDKDTSPSENTSEIPMEVKEIEEHSLGDLNEPNNYKAVILDLGPDKSARTHRAPDRLRLHVEVEEHSLGDLNEPNNYKAVILDLGPDKWVDAMNVKMQSMKDNKL
nr:hypothetical protein [Tanacetum cinerariifolium]